MVEKTQNDDLTVKLFFYSNSFKTVILIDFFVLEFFLNSKIVLTRFLNHKIRLILTRGLQRDFGLVLDLNSDVKRGLKADKIVEC